MAGMDDQALAQILIDKNIISSDQAEEARQQAEADGTTLVQTLLALSYVSASQIAQVMEGADQSAAEAGHTQPKETASATSASPGSDKAALASYDIEPDALRSIPRSLAEEYCVLPLQISQERILVAMADETNVLAIDAIRARTGRRVEPVEIAEAEIIEAIETYYSAQARAQTMVSEQVKDISATVTDTEAAAGVDREMISMLDDAPIVRVVETIISNAVNMRASDIHIEPRADRMQVRYRVDGQLMTVTSLRKDMHRYVLSRIKILAGEDIAETRLPQGGRFDTIINDRPIDLRVSTLPTFWGEKAVLRILDKSRVFVSLKQLGFSPQMQKEFEHLVTRPQGMILVTGPTGSGKSTTLYAALHTINDETKNITTIEDPIEYEVEGLNQTQVLPAIGLTFAEFLRNVLRQDPDVILIGEIRDLETAQMAFRASLTGHLVLSTLHTNDAPSAATRLVDLGIPPYLIASSLIGVLAQRLVRRICTHCREVYQPSEQELDALGLSAEQAQKIRFHRGTGCSHCRNTGYSGRIAVYELFTMNEELRTALSEGVPANQLRKMALQSTMKSLRYDALTKVHQGQTSVQEVLNIMFSPETL